MMGMPERFDADASLYAKAMGLSAPAGSQIVGGLICTGDAFCTHKEQTDAILKRFPQAAAVDMESAAIAHVCHLYQVPFISFRIISDSANGDAARINEYNDFWGEVAGRSFGIFEQFIVAMLAAVLFDACLFNRLIAGEHATPGSTINDYRITYCWYRN